jgi:hypothetical protein
MAKEYYNFQQQLKYLLGVLKGQKSFLLVLVVMQKYLSDLLLV